ncbi:hypothetical protein GobsT_00700 [Gemmata obscuriglobus]|uniref:Uncharacterized protein n=1 Tax=Gemmata obscuriglobus TaxID=114 RepID=A0A2Z3HEC1_9BACT|nr:hypothetical protein [Gemmata obscuriglobus]AWM41305.1 hypothetical protein C1280_32790 [Gemmata obscuriglobus]QEG25345.1 hypothetical protein GobsT_00700 [Gemmata obscuriglobus]VTR98297.1 Putative membrane protein OS=Rhodopirellula europaea SH398 GN=RESH_04153 PE=4 SV=1 [Gemmata obscuriglobus UQM 2246]
MLDFDNLDPNRNEDPTEADWFIAAKNRAATLGVALIATAVLCGLSNFSGLLALSAIRQNAAPQRPEQNVNADQRKQLERGRGAGPVLDFLCVGAISFVYLPVLIGGIALQRGSGRVFGIAAASCSMLPCSPGFLLALPVGVWALIVLNNEDVKAALDFTPPEEERPRRRRR